MAAIDQIVQISIVAGTAAVSQASFSIPLILGRTNPGWSDKLRTYASPAALLSDGYTTSAPEYIAAAAMFAQPIVPSSFKVGMRGASTQNQVDVLSVPSPATNVAYTLDMKGGYGVQSYTATGSTPTAQTVLQTILAGSISYSPNILSAVITGTGNSAILTITSLGPNNFAASNNITVNTTQPGGNVSTDIANAAAVDNTWYGLLLPGATDADRLGAATWVEANKKLFVTTSDTAAIAGTGTTDIASQLKAGAFNRTALLYSPASINQGSDAAWMGSQLSQTPGANTWAFKQLAGITADVLTDAAKANVMGIPVAQVAGKNANVYTNVGGVNVTQMGQAASGQYLDITVGLDWLQSQIQVNIYTLLVNNPKIPYTDIGATAFMDAVTQAIRLGGRNGLIDLNSPVSVTVTPVAQVPTNQRTNRKCPPITFNCRLQGAIHSVSVNGTVTV